MFTTEKRGERPSNSLLAVTRRLLRQSGLRARKGLAQHYLVDETALQKIIQAADLSPTDAVIEVGPGLGVLTGELVHRAGWVIAIELDEKLAELLRGTLAVHKNLTIINADVLKTDPAALLEDLRNKFAAPGYKVVANLPYYITSPVLRHFLEARLKPSLMVVMVQKEVAQAIAADPGDMSILSVSAQFYGRPEIVGYVPAESFYPPPEVDSAILRIEVYPEPAVRVSDTESFFELVRAGFAAARKQVANSLAQGLDLPKADILSMLERAGIDSPRRAETLSMEEWGRLWQEFAKSRRH